MLLPTRSYFRCYMERHARLAQWCHRSSELVARKSEEGTFDIVLLPNADGFEASILSKIKTMLAPIDNASMM